MGMHLFKLGLFGMLILFGAIAVFLGAVTGYAALQSGELTFVGSKGSATVARLADPSGFWRGILLAGALPIVGGIVAVWFGRRGLSRL
jgi:hypothetical protein